MVLVMIQITNNFLANVSLKIVVVISLEQKAVGELIKNSKKT
jgi:hypothetical protein